MVTDKMPLTAKTVWGKVVLYLKENRHVALHVACGDITDVTIADGKLVINVVEQMLAKLLLEGKGIIERALRWQGLELDVEVNLKKVQISDSEYDKKRLKEVFGEIQLIDRKNWR